MQRMAHGQKLPLNPTCSLARQTRSEVSPAASAASRSVPLTSSASCAHSACAALRLLRNAGASRRQRRLRGALVALWRAEQTGQVGGSQADALALEAGEAGDIDWLLALEESRWISPQEVLHTGGAGLARSGRYPCNVRAPSLQEAGADCCTLQAV